MNPCGQPDVVVVGGGLAGAAAAIDVARAGRNVVLLERSATAQHKVCGEFLSDEALGYLGALGVDVAALGAVSIHTVSMANVAHPLPFRAMSLTRRTLDEALLRTAAVAGVDVRRACHVRSMERHGAQWKVLVDSASASYAERSAIFAPDVFLATGKHDLRGRPRPAGRQAGLVGLKMYFRLAPRQMNALRGRVELILYRGGYAGLQSVEGDAANLCCLIERARLQHLGGWAGLLAAIRQESPELARRLNDAQPLLDRPLAISPIPYGYVRQGCEKGLWALGDQAAVIPSFTGDGMSIALHSGRLAAAMYLDGSTAAAFQARLQSQLKRQVLLATCISKGLVHPATRPLLSAAARACPALLGLIARQTRLSPAALVRPPNPHPLLQQ